MLVVKIDGGLGNQMFVYAFAMLLKQKGYEVGLDTSWFESIKNIKPFDNGIAKDTTRKLELTNYNISIPIIENFDSRLFFKTHDSNFLLKKKINKFMPKPFRKNPYKFNINDDLKLVEKMKEDKPFFYDNSYFSGFFQSLTYIDSIKDHIANEFKAKSNLSKEILNIKEMILDTEQSVFLHIRRGDYLLLKDRGYIQLSSKYYNEALSIMCKKLTKPHIFIFSNDIKWCKQEFLKNIDKALINQATFDFIDKNDEGNAFEEIELMRSCKNAIIANSTFSWWAAYLINNPQKTIIAPSKVFISSTKERMADFYPKEWNLIEV